MFVMYVTCYRDNGQYFYVVVHFFSLNATGRQLRAPLFARNRFVMYITLLYVTCCLYNLGCQACVRPTEVRKTQVS